MKASDLFDIVVETEQIQYIFGRARQFVSVHRISLRGREAFGVTTEARPGACPLELRLIDVAIDYSDNDRFPSQVIQRLSTER